MRCDDDQRIVLLELEGETAHGVRWIDSTGIRKVAVREAQAVSEFRCLLAEANDHDFIAWVDVRLAGYVRSPEDWVTLLKHPLEVLHLSGVQRCHEMVDSLGYVEFDSPFLLPTVEGNRFPTWLISAVGGIGRADVLRSLVDQLGCERASFQELLLLIGRAGLQVGMCAYHEPRLLREILPSDIARRVISSHSPELVGRLIGHFSSPKWWVFWFASCLRDGKGLSPSGFAASIRPARSFASPFRLPPAIYAELEAVRTKAPETLVGVVIPTLERPAEVLQILRDLASQTLLPSCVVVVDQSSDDVRHDLSERIQTAAWPFPVRHERVPWRGACRARNHGLALLTETTWTLLLDDDVRIEPGYVAHMVSSAEAYGVEALNTLVYSPGEERVLAGSQPHPIVWSYFASGCGLLDGRLAREVRFDEALEGGFGEDYEFGIQLRRRGTHILQTCSHPVLHLRVQSGGFRAPYPHPWHGHSTQPRPSPTVLSSRRKHITSTMEAGYRRFYCVNRISQIRSLKDMLKVLRLRREWRAAIEWSNYLLSGRKDKSRPAAP